MQNLLDQTLLGKPADYIFTYEPKLLQALPRNNLRQRLPVPHPKPFFGKDIWNAYELSWLNLQGKPEVAVAEFLISDDSINLIESKSFKLYLNSFNASKFANQETVQQTLKKDLSEAVQGEVSVNLHSLEHVPVAEKPNGICLDDLNVDINHYHYWPDYLSNENINSHESVYTNLFRSLCPVTGQPDWATIVIEYYGKKISHQGLLKYLISYRHHAEFHEQCVERIFMDITKYCVPEKLAVYARFTRRGGIDINPYRTNFAWQPNNIKLFRQ